MPITFPADCEVFWVEIQKYWPEKEWENALLVVKKESTCRKAVVGPTNDHGGWQIHDGLNKYGARVYDPIASTEIAYYDFYVPRKYRPWYAVEGILWSR